MFTSDRILNDRDFHSWAFQNSNETNEIYFQHIFSVNIWCRIIGLMGLFVFEHGLIAEKLHTLSCRLLARTAERCVF